MPTLLPGFDSHDIQERVMRDSRIQVLQIFDGENSTRYAVVKVPANSSIAEQSLLFSNQSFYTPNSSN